MLLTHAVALSAVYLGGGCKETGTENHRGARKSPCEYVHSVRIELAKLMFVGTRITYQATGDGGRL